MSPKGFEEGRSADVLFYCRLPQLHTEVSVSYSLGIALSQHTDMYVAIHSLARYGWHCIAWALHRPRRLFLIEHFTQTLISLPHAACRSKLGFKSLLPTQMIFCDIGFSSIFLMHCSTYLYSLLEVFYSLLQLHVRLIAHTHSSSQSWHATHQPRILLHRTRCLIRIFCKHP